MPWNINQDTIPNIMYYSKVNIAPLSKIRLILNREGIFGELCWKIWGNFENTVTLLKIYLMIHMENSKNIQQIRVLDNYYTSRLQSILDS